MLRVSSDEPGWDPEVFLRDHFPGAVAPWWRAGDVHAGRTRGHAGFNLRIAASNVVDDMVAWVREHGPVLEALQSDHAHLEADIGLGVGTDNQFEATVVFTSEQLRVLVESGIDVKISAYPVASEPK